MYSFPSTSQMRAPAARAMKSGSPVEGRAYAELVGYDRSHEQPSIFAFLFGDSLDRRWRSIFG